MEQEAKEIPRGDISEEAVIEAQRICEALGRRDELTAARAVQVAELLCRKRWGYLLTDALARIRNVRRSDDIRRPIPYLCATVLSLAQGSRLTDDERALAADVLAFPPPAYGGASPPKRRTAAELKQGYEWLIDDGEQSTKAEFEEVERELDAIGDQAYGWFFGEKVPRGIQERHDYLKHRKSELEGQLRRRGYGWHFGE